MSFAGKIIEKDGGLVRFITGVEAGKACWFFVEIDPLTYPDYKWHLRQGSMDVRDYGTILKCGWGDTPPQDIAQHMRQEYNAQW